MGAWRLVRSGMALLALTLGCVVLIGEAVPAAIGFALCGLGIAHTVPLLNNRGFSREGCDFAYRAPERDA